MYKIQTNPKGKDNQELFIDGKNTHSTPNTELIVGAIEFQITLARQKKLRGELKRLHENIHKSLDGLDFSEPREFLISNEGIIMENLIEANVDYTSPVIIDLKHAK